MAYFKLIKKVALEKFEFVNDICDEVSYSFKTNPEVGTILEKNTDCSFSAHSYEEQERIHDKSRVWLFAQGWNEEDIQDFIDKGVHKFVVDNESDLDALLKFIEEKNDLKIDLLLRMRMKERTVHTGKYFVFGMYSDKINELIPKLKANDSISQLGVHFHRKTQNVSEWSLKYELENALAAETLDAIDILNIGGGLPSEYKNSRGDVMKSILEKLSETRSWLKEHDIKMIIEPGRFIAAPAVKLVTTIKNIYDNNIIVDASVYNTFIDTFVANMKLMVEGEFNDEDYKAGKAQMYTIKGRTPCSLDMFRYRVFLDKPKVGDRIVFLNAGAYNFSTDFCSLKMLATRIVD